MYALKKLNFAAFVPHDPISTKIANLPKKMFRPKYARIVNLKIPEPVVGNIKLCMYPFSHKKIILPFEFSMWQQTVQTIMSMIPCQSNADQHYLTIDSEFFVQKGYQKNSSNKCEELHIDGNFCADPEFSFRQMINFLERQITCPQTYELYLQEKKSLSKTEPIISDGKQIVPSNLNYTTYHNIKIPYNFYNMTHKDALTCLRRFINNYKPKQNNSHVNCRFLHLRDNSIDFALPYDIIIPVGKYISNELGGIMTISTQMCGSMYPIDYEHDDVCSGGKMPHAYIHDSVHMQDNFFKENELYFMTSNMPYRMWIPEQGTRRTLLHITLNHNYENKVMFNNIQ